MSKEQMKTNWELMKEKVSGVADEIWEKVKESEEFKDKRNIYYSGYYLKNTGFLNYPPRVEIRAELDLPEGPSSDPNPIQTLINTAVNGIETEGFSLNVTSKEFYPQMSALEKDNVFGTDAELPKSVTFIIKADYEDFKIRN